LIPLTLREIAAIVGGELHDADPDLLVTGPAFLDSRSPLAGGLFAAFAGEHVDGHAYAPAAVEGGAAAVLGTRATGEPTVVVPDTQAALQVLAQDVLRRLRGSASGLRVLAVTGSQGKTSAKDMLDRVLGDAAPTVATYGSFNNEIGLPLTVLRADYTTRYLVLEMGARGIGHLAELCAIAPPDVALVLNVGKAHIGEFGSQANIARAKGELVEAVVPGGAAVLNADDPLVAGMAPRTTARIWTFGRDAFATVRLEDVETDALNRPAFDLLHADARQHVALRLMGEHQALNAAAVTAAALALGVPFRAVAASLRAIDHLSKWRMQLQERPDGLILINDAYNANPDSMRAALETLAAVGRRSGRRTVAVLGEMRELGAASVEEHAAVGRLAHQLGIASVLVIGEPARPILTALREERGDDGTTHHVDTVDGATTWVRQNVSGSDVVLVKASRGDGLERVAEAAMTRRPFGEEMEANE
jgi:UDP-N-acetylmuramoyl-tripeptide--D-alanyl-D-alanine ligase